MASTSVSGASTSTSADFDKWYSTTKETVLDLKMSDDDFIKFVSKEFASAQGSEEKRNALQQLVNLRSQIATGLSNIMRVLGDTARYLINNIRP